MVDKFRISVARVARIEDSWFKDMYIDMQLQHRSLQPEQLKEENLNIGKSWNVTFLFNFLRLSEGFDSLQKKHWSKQS